MTFISLTPLKKFYFNDLHQHELFWENDMQNANLVLKINLPRLIKEGLEIFPDQIEAYK